MAPAHVHDWALKNDMIDTRHFDTIGAFADADVTAKLLHAACFAAIKHSKQRRKDPEQSPYINHPLGVAHLLISVGGLRVENADSQKVEKRT